MAEPCCVECGAPAVVTVTCVGRDGSLLDNGPIDLCDEHARRSYGPEGRWRARKEQRPC